MLLILRHYKDCIQTSSARNVRKHSPNRNIFIWKKQVDDETQSFQSLLNVFSVLPIKMLLLLCVYLRRKIICYRYLRQCFRYHNDLAVVSLGNRFYNGRNVTRGVTVIPPIIRCVAMEIYKCNKLLFPTGQK